MCPVSFPVHSPDALLLSWFPRHLSLCHLGTAPLCLSSAMCLLTVVPSDLLSGVIRNRLGSPSWPLPSVLLFFFEVGELSLNLLALMNLRQREKGERFPITPVNSPMLGALELIWQKEKARRNLLLGGLPGCLALHPSPSPDNSIQLTRQETGVLSRPAAKKATFPSGEKTRLGWPPSPPPQPLSGVSCFQLKCWEEEAKPQSLALKQEKLIQSKWNLGQLLLQLELQARRGQRSQQKDPGRGQRHHHFTTITSNLGYSLTGSSSSKERVEGGRGNLHCIYMSFAYNSFDVQRL